MKTWAIYYEHPVAYSDGVYLQNKLLEARINDLIPDTVIFLEHLPVITRGVRSQPGQILLPENELRKQGIALAEASRGGAVTFHAPGQVVMYPIIRLDGRRKDARGYLECLEETAIRAAASFEVTAYRRKGMTGAWTDQGKLAAIGVRFKRWVAYHGMSFNVDLDLSGFSTIVPCGLAGEKVTSLKLLLESKCPSLKEARACLANHFSSVFARDLAVIHQKRFFPSQWPYLLAMLR